VRVVVIVVGELGAVKAEQELVRGNPLVITSNVRPSTLSHNASYLHDVDKVSLHIIKCVFNMVLKISDC